MIPRTKKIPQSAPNNKIGNTLRIMMGNPHIAGLMTGYINAGYMNKPAKKNPRIVNSKSWPYIPSPFSVKTLPWGLFKRDDPFSLAAAIALQNLYKCDKIGYKYFIGKEKVSTRLTCKRQPSLAGFFKYKQPTRSECTVNGCTVKITPEHCIGNVKSNRIPRGVNCVQVQFEYRQQGSSRDLLHLPRYIDNTELPFILYDVHIDRATKHLVTEAPESPKLSYVCTLMSKLVHNPRNRTCLNKLKRAVVPGDVKHSSIQKWFTQYEEVHFREPNRSNGSNKSSTPNKPVPHWSRRIPLALTRKPLSPTKLKLARSNVKNRRTMYTRNPTTYR